MRNEDRLGVGLEDDHHSKNSPSPPQQTQGILSFPAPTEFVDLPSGGEYYLEGHPLHGKEKIEIKMMTAKEEDILLNENYLRSGVVIDKLLNSVLVDRTIKLDDLVIGDKNALLFATRISGLGAEYSANLSCGFCGTSAQEDYDLNQFGIKEVNLPSDIIKTDSKTFLIILPSTQLKVELKLLDGKSQRIIESTVAKRKKHKLPENRLVVMLEQMVVSINDITDRVQISQCLAGLPIKDIRHLRKSYEVVTPDLDLTHTHVCSTCGKEQEVTLPLSANFFWDNK